MGGVPQEELSEVVEFLRSPERFERLGARVPKGILLYGRRAPARR
jgi:cell division protease FtsH